jgi:hypothetical protein
VAHTAPEACGCVLAQLEAPEAHTDKLMSPEHIQLQPARLCCHPVLYLQAMRACPHRKLGCLRHHTVRRNWCHPSRANTLQQLHDQSTAQTAADTRVSSCALSLQARYAPAVPSLALWWKSGVKPLVDLHFWNVRAKEDCAEKDCLRH